MNFLLDTCVISELVAKKPNEQVLRWIDTVDPASVYLSVVTIGEICKGIEKLPGSKRKTSLERWLDDELLVRFSGRIASIDTDVMLLWGKMVARLEMAGKTMSAIDSLIAAIALHGKFQLVTRNEEGFRDAGVRIVNPWE